ncbi:hypothetical protein L218DRAFT_989301 [Marasmius fiardii PR-910]|nr:hypothetical protein L218DRAFT_989301 [Marasmius fiardii PR-910]
MSHLGRTIAEHKKRHAQLLQAIARNEDATETLAVNEKKVAELEAQLEEVERESKAKIKRGAKFVDGCPHTTSIASKLSFLRKSTENVREKSLLDSEKPTRLEQAISEAQFEGLKLQRKVNEYHALQQELDELYDAVFNGPTPSFPSEDQLKQQVTAAEALCDRVNSMLMAETEALEYISKAEKTMRECKAKLKEALESVAISMFASWRSGQDHEAVNLQTAHELACRVPYLVREAQQRSPEIRSLGELSIIKIVPSRTEQSVDHYYTLIKTAASEVNSCHDQLSDECTVFASRVSISKSVTVNAQQTFLEYRNELRALRRKIFEDIAEKAQDDPNLGEAESEYPVDAPPSYEYDPPPLPPGSAGFTFMPTLIAPSPLSIPNKTIRRSNPLPKVPSPPSPTSSSGSDTPGLPWSSPMSGRRIRPLPRPPVS